MSAVRPNTFVFSGSGFCTVKVLYRKKCRTMPTLCGKARVSRSNSEIAEDFGEVARASCTFRCAHWQCDVIVSSKASGVGASYPESADATFRSNSFQRVIAAGVAP